MATSPFAAPLGSPIFRWFDANGNPAASWQLATYVAGTNTPLATYPTYADALAGTNANANPVVLDGNGAAQVWVQATAYKLVMLLPVALGNGMVYTQDNVQCGTAYPGSFLSPWVLESNGVLFQSATQFKVLGVDVTQRYHIGRRVRTQNTGGTVYSTVSSSSFAVDTTVNLANDGAGVLDAGLSAAWYGLEPYADPAYLDPRAAFTARLTANQTGFAASTKLAGWTVEEDAMGNWNAANNRYLLTKPGYYLVNASYEYADTVASVDCTAQIAFTGSIVAQARCRASPVATNIWSVSAHRIIRTTGTTGYVEAFFLGTANTTVQGTIGTRLTVSRIP